MTISWYDPPNVSSAAKALLNDIDLVATAPNGVVYYGNGKGRRDTVNNNERIAVAAPALGDWTVRIVIDHTFASYYC